MNDQIRYQQALEMAKMVLESETAAAVWMKSPSVK